MSFDKPTRNALSRMVSACRNHLTDDIRDQMQRIYGLQPDGKALPVDKLAHLDDQGRGIADALRQWQDHLAASEKGTTDEVKAKAFDRMARETAFTVLNRLAALRMCEERDHVIECVNKGLGSAGFRIFENVAGDALGSRGKTYQLFLERMFDELAIDLGVLFDRSTPQSLVFPSEQCLEEVLELLDDKDLAHLWKEDETIGWIYQYFNSKEEREAMRKASQAPQNSRELAVRNQFFTPRYVVEFLTDNTLGRIWYEMRKGETSLKDQCGYLVRRPNEVFLAEGEKVDSGQKAVGSEELSQEELLKQPVYIEHRPLKDPRDIKMLDPACGSMHFGLYAFDLFERIYNEAWDLEQTLGQEAFDCSEDLKPLTETFQSKVEFLQSVPKLIIERNIHGIDIDPRAVQIATLSLWLRAQRSWKEQDLKPVERPQINKSNIVCAEPMPGEKDMLKEFTATLKPKILGQLVEIIFDKMKLAGEAGSLLKIEEEIKDAVAEARKQWLDGPKMEQGLLFPDIEARQIQQLEMKFDVSGVTDEGFWEQAEDRILDALRDYAEQAENGHAARRRLFAEDAARGFAFIDLCRKRYDAVLMNPPFGDAAAKSKQYLTRAYPLTKSDLYSAFVERGLFDLHHGGMLGAITSRSGFFQSSFQKWRTQVLLPIAPPLVVADLGANVLDGAMVETAAYCLRKGELRNSTFIRLGREAQKSVVLLDALKSLSDGFACGNIFEVSGNSFSAIPGSPFAYWIPESIRRLFSDLPQYEDNGRTVKQGLATADDFRFVRAFWEVKPSAIARVKTDAEKGNYWFPYPKGGEFSPFYADIPLLVDWEFSGMKYWHNLSATGGVRSNIWMLNESAKNYFFQPGLTYPRRLHRLAVMPMPSGSIISVRGSGIYGPTTYLLRIAGLFSSSAFDFLVKCMLGRFEHPQFDNGTLCRTPIPNGFPECGEALEEPTALAIHLKRRRDTRNEISHLFFRPAISAISQSLATAAHEWLGDGEDTANRIEIIQAQINETVFSLYGFDQQARNALCVCSDQPDESSYEEEQDEDDVPEYESGDAQPLVCSIASYAVGLAFGRWDIRIALDESLAPKLPEPFDPLPVCPPGMLVGPDGLPVEANRIVSEEWLRARPNANTLPPEGSVTTPTISDSEYPLRISWDGILVDNPGFNGAHPHRDDILQRVREVFDLLWKDKSEDIEQEACDILGVSDLRDYFRKPSGFFQDHLKRYSKSRRQAPIYWPLSTQSGSYTLWIYYHRLNEDLIYKAINSYVLPKIESTQRLVRETGSQLEQASGKEATRLRKDLEEGESLLAELGDFHDELLRVANLPYKPDLNDGVAICAAPLYKLFRLTKWSKYLEGIWQKLEEGEYDWAHLAYAIWPDRVREKCKKDRSLAIAHDLEAICEVEPTKPKKKKKGKKKP